MAAETSLSIGALSKATGTTVEAIRWYERVGVLPAPARTAGNYRAYGTAHLERLSFVRRARDLGFTLDQVRELLRLADRTARHLRAGGHAGRTVVLKVRFADFTTITRSRTLREATDVAQEIYATARGLYEALGLQRARIRLVGVRLEQLVERASAPIQGLLDEPDFGWRDADRAVDRASARFGAGSVRPASLIVDPSTSPRPRRDLS